MHLLLKISFIGLLCAAQARFIDESVLAEGDVVPDSVVNVQLNAAKLADNEIVDVVQQVEKVVSSAEQQEQEQQQQESLQLTTTTTNEPKDNETKTEQLVENGRAVIHAAPVQITLPSLDTLVKEKIFKFPVLVINETVPASTTTTTRTPASTTQAPDASSSTTRTTQTSTTTAAPSTTTKPRTTQSPFHYKPLKPFFFPAPPHYAYGHDSNNVLTMGFVLLPNPFFYKKSVDHLTRNAPETATTGPALPTFVPPNEESAATKNPIHANINAPTLNPIYFYLDPNHMSHFAGEAEKEQQQQHNWIPLLMPRLQTAQPGDAGVLAPIVAPTVPTVPGVPIVPFESLLNSGIKIEEEQLSTGTVTPSSDDNSVLFAVEIPKPIYSFFKSIFGVFSA